MLSARANSETTFAVPICLCRKTKDSVLSPASRIHIIAARSLPDAHDTGGHATKYAGTTPKGGNGMLRWAKARENACEVPAATAAQAAEQSGEAGQRLWVRSGGKPTDARADGRLRRAGGAEAAFGGFPELELKPDPFARCDLPRNLVHRLRSVNAARSLFHTARGESCRLDGAHQVGHRQAPATRGQSTKQSAGIKAGDERGRQHTGHAPVAPSRARLRPFTATAAARPPRRASQAPVAAAQPINSCCSTGSSPAPSLFLSLFPSRAGRKRNRRARRPRCR